MVPSSVVTADSSAIPPLSVATPILLSPTERGWKHRRFSILREVLGPDFHGPSSSHTGAPQLMGITVHHLLGGPPEYAAVVLLNSFAMTGAGHRTHIAVVAGLLGIRPTDPLTPNAMQLAAQRGLIVRFTPKVDPAEHPNTLILKVQRGPMALEVKGISIGGGNFEIVEVKRAFASAA